MSYNENVHSATHCNTFRVWKQSLKTKSRVWLLVIRPRYWKWNWICGLLNIYFFFKQFFKIRTDNLFRDCLKEENEPDFINTNHMEFFEQTRRDPKKIKEFLTNFLIVNASAYALFLLSLLWLGFKMTFKTHPDLEFPLGELSLWFKSLSGNLANLVKLGLHAKMCLANIG